MLTALGAMQLAILEAKKGWGHVSPNPPVGCVILDKSGNFLAKGHHRKFGGDHAEIDALKEVREPKLLDGATLFVTLEPCAHHGKTPPCAEALAKLPLSKVVYGLVDPNPLVAGKGLEILKSAGKIVQSIASLVGESSASVNDDLEDLAEVFLFNQRERKTFASVKVATTLDGNMAHVSGESQWLTSEEARDHAQYLRGLHDAVIIGAGTFRHDNPRLNVRHAKFENKKNHVIVVNTSGSCLEKIEDSALYQSHEPRRIIVAAGESNASVLKNKSSDVEIWLLPERDGLIDLSSVLKKAYASGLMSVFVEGGARLISQFIEHNHAHRLYQFIAPQILGRRSGRAFTESVTSLTFAARVTMKRPVWTPMGPDVLLSGRF